MPWEDVVAQIAFQTSPFQIPAKGNTPARPGTTLSIKEQERLIASLESVYNESQKARELMDELGDVAVRGNLSSGSWYYPPSTPFTDHRVLIDFENLTRTFLSQTGRISTFGQQDPEIGLGLIFLHELTHSLGSLDPVASKDLRTNFSNPTFDHLGQTERLMTIVRNEINEGRTLNGLEPIEARGSYTVLENYRGSDVADYLDSLGETLLGVYDQSVVFVLGNPSTTAHELFRSDKLKIEGHASRDLVVAFRLIAEVNTGGGNDKVFGHLYGDRLFAGADNDTVFGVSGADFIFGGTGHDELIGDEGADYIKGERGDDRTAGGGGNDEIYGDEGNDILLGEGANDRILGGIGSDDLIGGAGNDTLDGQAGADALTGGKGADTFVFTMSDRVDIVMDYQNGSDFVDLSTILGSAWSAGDQIRDLIRLIDSEGGSNATLEVFLEQLGPAGAWVAVAELRDMAVGDVVQLLLTSNDQMPDAIVELPGFGFGETSLVFKDSFNRTDSGIVGNGWREIRETFAVDPNRFGTATANIGEGRANFTYARDDGMGGNGISEYRQPYMQRRLAEDVSDTGFIMSFDFWGGESERLRQFFGVADAASGRIDTHWLEENPVLIPAKGIGIEILRSGSESENSQIVLWKFNGDADFQYEDPLADERMGTFVLDQFQFEFGVAYHFEFAVEVDGRVTIAIDNGVNRQVFSDFIDPVSHVLDTVVVSSIEMANDGIDIVSFDKFRVEEFLL